MYRNLFGILAVFGAALLLVGVTFSASTEEPATFTFINGTEPKSLDPAIMTGQPEGRIAEAIFEGLTYHDPASLVPMPGMAESWTISADGRLYEFKIREGVAWADGTPITAHDFAWSWRRMQEPDVASEYAYILHMVKWAEIFNTYENHAVALVGPTKGETALAAVDRLSREFPQGVDGPTWKAQLIDAHHLNDALKGVQDAVLLEALGHREGRLAPDRIAAIRAAIEAEGARRRALAKEASEKFGRTEGVFARDDRTLVVELKALTPYFLELTAFYPTFPVPRHVVEAHPDDWFLPGRITTNGPYRLVSWRPNQKIRLQKSPTYWGRDSIRLEIIDCLPVENVATALNLYLTGDVDWLPSNYPNDLLDVLKQRPDFHRNTGYVTYFYRFNCKKPPFTDARVRQAVCLAVNRQVIVDHIGRLGQPVAHHFVPGGVPGYEPPSTEIAYDPKRAKELLDEARRDGVQVGPFGILYNTQEGHRRIAENVADQLRENLGISVQAYNQEWQAYQQSVRDMTYDMARAGWIGDYLDPNTFLDMWVTNGGNNQTGWSHPLYDRLISFAADVEQFVNSPEPWIGRLKEQDRARELLAAVGAAGDASSRVRAASALRLHLLREAEAILVQDGFPIMPVYFYVVSSLVKPRVEGFHSTLTFPDGSTTPNLQDIHPLRGFSIREAAR